MTTKFNPFTGNFDFVETTGGASGTPAVPNFILNFDATSNWGLASLGYYTITVLEAIHGKGINPTVEVFEKIGLEYRKVITTEIVTSTGDVLIQSLQSPDTRFEGRIIIGENT
jgi:hypothetical protein